MRSHQSKWRKRGGRRWLWACRVEWELETIRGGTSLGAVPISSRPFYTFGRTPDNGAPPAPAHHPPPPLPHLLPQLCASMCWNGGRDGERATAGAGRPVADIVAEHPSASRLHAVIQFHAVSGDAFLYDAASAHGTFLNRRRLKPGVHAPLR